MLRSRTVWDVVNQFPFLFLQSVAAETYILQMARLGFPRNWLGAKMSIGHPVLIELVWTNLWIGELLKLFSILVQ